MTWGFLETLLTCGMNEWIWGSPPKHLFSALISLPYVLLWPCSLIQVKVLGGIIFPRRSFYLEESSSGGLSKVGQVEVKHAMDQGALKPSSAWPRPGGMGLVGSDRGVPCPFELAGTTSSLLHVSSSRSCPVGGGWKYHFQGEGVHWWSLTWGSACFWWRFWQVWKGVWH